MRGVEVRQALTSHGQCVIEMQVPLFAGTAYVTFTIADVIDPIMPAPTLVANGPKVVF